MLRICIPVHNEATTIGVLLWRLRSVFQGFSREYDVTVYDDASTDGTADVLEPYQSVMPLTVLRGARHAGYAGSIDALVRHVAADDEYARRDAMILLQGDFTESPEHLPELVKRFEGGADLVAVHRIISDDTPVDERRLRRWGRLAVKPFLRMPPLADPFTGFRLVRIAVLRDLLKAMGNRPVCAGEGWAANIDFALNVTPFARRIENVEFAPRYDVRQRASRRQGWTDVLALFHWARSARSAVRPVPGSKAGVEQLVRGEQATIVPVPTERLRASPPERTDRAERGGRGERTRPPRDMHPAQRESTAGERPAEERHVDERPRRDERPEVREERVPREREGRNAREERALRGEDLAPPVERSAREPREPREPRETRPPRPPRTDRPPREDGVVAAVAESVIPAELVAPVDFVAPKLRDAAGGDEAVELAAADVVEGLREAGPEAGAKRKRRRRRSRKKGAHAADGSLIPGDDADGSDEDGDGSDSDVGHSGTSAHAEGEQQEGTESGDDADGDDDVRRKRRPRRRRRGRRPGGNAGGQGDDELPASPAADPPAA